MNEIMQYLSSALIVLGALAFITSAIVQTIKEMPHLAGIPTELVALVISEVVTVVAVFAGCSYFDITMLWYYIVAAVVVGFFVYMISTGGWEKLNAIWERTKYNGKNFK